MIPNGWIETTIKQINTRKSAGIEPARFPNEFFELYSVPSFDSREPEILKGSEIGSTKQIVEEGDVLICKINPRINRVWVVGNKTKHRKIASSEWIVVNTNGVVDSSYLMYEFSAPFFRQLLESEVSGVGGSLTRARPKLVENYGFPLAPLSEQKRIVAKLDTLFSHLDQLKARLEKIPTLLKQFRQSVLTQAVTGKLTEEWREGEPSISERRSDTDLEEPFEIPDSWQFVFLNQVCDKFTYGTSAKSDDKGDVVVLRMGNLQDGRLDWTDLKFTSDKDEISKYQLKKGDVLFNRTNSPELVGKTSVFDGSRPAIYAGYLIKIWNTEKLNSYYLNIILNSPYGREWSWKSKTDGVSQSNINAKKLAAFVIPLPAPEEQKEIVRRVESLFAIADRIEASYKTLQEKIGHLPQAILCKAFRGELVGSELSMAAETDVTYEAVNPIKS